MGHRRIRIALVLACLGSLGGCLRCGGRTDGELVLPESDFPDRLVATQCAQTDECCREAGYASSTPQCSEETRTRLLPQLAEAQAAGATYDPAAAAACVRTFASRCADRESAKTAREHGLCGRVYVRAKNPLGSPCLSDWACPAGAVCGQYRNGDSVVRVCQSLTLRNEGEPCGETTPEHVGDCASPLWCDSGTCKRLPELGEPCNGAIGDLCAPGSMCDRLNTKRCIVPPRAVGESCTALEQCEGYRCNNGRCLPLGNFANVVDCAP